MLRRSNKKNALAKCKVTIYQQAMQMNPVL